MSSVKLIQNLNGGVNTAVTSISEAAIFQTISEAAQALKKPIIIITKNDSEARRIADELTSFCATQILWYPKQQLTFHDLEAESSDIRSYRLKVIDSVLGDECSIIVTTPEGLMTPLCDKSLIREYTYRVGDVIDVDDFVPQMIDSGYERVSIVDGKEEVLLTYSLLAWIRLQELNCLTTK